MSRNLLIALLFVMPSIAHSQVAIPAKLQYQQSTPDGAFEVRHRLEGWQPDLTAVIVCDVWDYHHCLNAVRRLEEFGPRLNDVLTEARRMGCVIIHAPSDCMPAYADHPARLRAIETPQASRLPNDIEHWCSVIPAEEKAVYPIDQFDGGEDDDPEEHSRWAAKLKEMGRNPGMPWKKQSDMIDINAERDYITDRGDEVWNILEARQIRNVILTGVHVNMCVLGRPFGLRQMARNGKNVALMRDMTDAMYNPKRWPFVSHYEGTRRVISHIERYICPTMTSDVFMGGQPFHFKNDPKFNQAGEHSHKGQPYVDYWTRTKLPIPDPMPKMPGPVWTRAVVRVPADWTENDITLVSKSGALGKVWWNGTPADAGDANSVKIPLDAIMSDDANLLVIQYKDPGNLQQVPTLVSGSFKMNLAGTWQVRTGNNPDFANMPLPAKFGAGSDIVFTDPQPLWSPQVVTRIGEFTDGIEGPACDAHGNIFAVNFEKQGTIGKVTPDGHGEIFVTLPEGSTGNGIRFDAAGNFFVADYTGHNVLHVNAKTREVSVFAHNPEMNQPNDLAIAPNGTLYASDPNWKDGTGQVWKIDSDGQFQKVAADMGTTNGIEVSPDGKLLYVNESKQRNIWMFDIAADGSLNNKRLLKMFEDHGFDGMRCDIDGNLYVTRYGKGTVVKLSPQGEILQEIPVLGEKPSNICFGGPDGRTAYVTEVEYTRLVSFRVDRPGRSFVEAHDEN